MKKAELVEILGVLAKGLERNKELPILEHICFTDEIVYSSNQLFTITTPSTPFEVKKPFGVNGSTFIDLLGASPSSDIKFKVEGTDLVVKAGPSDFELPVKTIDEFIWSNPDVTGPVLDKVVANSMQFVLPTCSENQALEGFARICIKNEGGQIILYSADGDAMSKYMTGLSSNDRINITLTRKFCSIINEITPTGIMTIGKDWVKVEGEKFTVYGQNLGETTIDYEFEMSNLHGNNHDDTVSLPIGFKNSLERAAVVARYETAATMAGITDEKLLLITETPFGNVYDTLEFKHEEMELKINAELLLKQLGDLNRIQFMPNCIVLKNDRLLKLVATM